MQPSAVSSAAIARSRQPSHASRLSSGRAARPNRAARASAASLLRAFAKARMQGPAPSTPCGPTPPPPAALMYGLPVGIALLSSQHPGRKSRRFSAVQALRCRQIDCTRRPATSLARDSARESCLREHGSSAPGPERPGVRIANAVKRSLSPGAADAWEKVAAALCFYPTGLCRCCTLELCGRWRTNPNCGTPFSDKLELTAAR